MSEQANQGGGTLPSFDSEMAEIVESFIVESNEILERLGPDLLQLEKNATNTELHNVIFRAVHTLKGTSSFLGFEQMTTLAHHFEDVLNKVRRHELAVTSDKIDVMFEAYDLLKILLQRIESRDATPVDLTQILPKLEIIAQGGPVQEQKAHDAGTTDETKPEPRIESASTRSDPGEPLLVSEDPEHREEKKEATQSAQAAPGKSSDSSIRVDVGRLDTLMNLVGELVLGRNQLSQISHQIGELHEDISLARELAETNAHIDFITTELQMAVMKTRMVPVAKIFNKLPRLIRELSKEMGKEIDLVIEGEETELDKTLIEELNDPMVHLLRNAADHGIEMPEERVAVGKSSRGTIIVKAEHGGNHFIVSVQDDGRGMDPEKLKAKGVEKGMITEAQAHEMSTQDAFSLVFEPGFSTARQVTNVSGRGVGMDVVRTNIQRLKGTVTIESETGVGTTFVIKLPLTLAILQALLVEVEKEIFSVPLDSVLEVVKADRADVSLVNGLEVIRLRDRVLPVVRLSDVLGMHASVTDSGTFYVVVVGIQGEQLGLVVDSLLGQKEIVIKSIGEYLGNIKGIAGSTILGDGRVIMIIDVGELMRMCSDQLHSHHN